MVHGRLCARSRLLANLRDDWLRTDWLDLGRGWRQALKKLEREGLAETSEFKIGSWILIQYRRKRDESE